MVFPQIFREKALSYSSSLSTTLPNSPIIFAFLFHKYSHNFPSFTFLYFFPQFPVAYPLTIFNLFHFSLSSSQVFSHFLTGLLPLPYNFSLFPHSSVPTSSHLSPFPHSSISASLHIFPHFTTLHRITIFFFFLPSKIYLHNRWYSYH